MLTKYEVYLALLYVAGRVLVKYLREDNPWEECASNTDAYPADLLDDPLDEDEVTPSTLTTSHYLDIDLRPFYLFL